MGRTEKRISLAILAALILVAALYAYQTLASAQEVEVYGISVILCRGGGNFEKGLNGAALESNADVHIVTLSGADFAAQTAALERELNNGARAVILYLADRQAIAAWLDKNNPSVPIVLVGDAVSPGKGASAVSIDVGALAAAVVSEIEAQPPRELTVVDSGGGSAARLAVLKQALEAAGFTYNVALANDMGRLTPGRAYVALDAAAAETLCGLWTEGALIYGMGYGAKLRDALETGKIKALAIVSEFDAGYLAMQEAVARIGGARARGVGLETFVARAENMYESPISTILFPIG